MNFTEQVLKIIGSKKALKKDEEEMLLNAVRYCINIDLDDLKIADEVRSQMFGVPNLPAQVQWPKGYYFFAQLLFHEIKPYDRLNLLPEDGVLFLFLDPMAKDFSPASETAVRGVFYSGIIEDLKPGKSPDKESYSDKGKYYSKNFEKTYRLLFNSAFTCQFVQRKELLRDLQKELSIPYLETLEYSIFGFPQTWQGEDEDELFAPPDWDWQQGTPKEKDLLMLMQAPFFEGHLHIWIDRHQLAQKDFTKLFATASVT